MASQAAVLSFLQAEADSASARVGALAALLAAAPPGQQPPSANATSDETLKPKKQPLKPIKQPLKPNEAIKPQSKEAKGKGSVVVCLLFQRKGACQNRER